MANPPISESKKSPMSGNPSPRKASSSKQTLNVKLNPTNKATHNLAGVQPLKTPKKASSAGG